MSEGAVDDLVARAERALADVGRDPNTALAEADAVVAAIPRPLAPEQVRAVVTAHRAAGLALRELSEIEEAEARLRRAVRLADNRRLPDVAAEARMTLAFTLMERGRMLAALRAVDAGLQHVNGLQEARLLTTRALVLQRSGRSADAAVEYEQALPTLRRYDDRVWEARLLNNRSMLAAMSGRTADAVDDLHDARNSYLADGKATDAADCLFNIGYVFGMSGDVTRALEYFDAAETEWADLERPECWAGRAEVMLRAGLAADAVSCARRSIAGLSQRGWHGLEVEARLMLALTLLSVSPPAPDEAEEELAAVRALLVHQVRPEWRALADYATTKAALARPGAAASATTAAAVAEVLAAAGWRSYAADIRLAAARALLAAGDGESARAALMPLALATRTRELDVRGRAWLARALLVDIDHDGPHGHTGSQLAYLRRAWGAIDEHRRTVGGTELRAGAAAHASAAVDLALAKAVALGSPATVFDWCERGRAAVLRFPPAHPPDDAGLAGALARLRWAENAHDQSRLSGDADAAAGAMRYQAEREVIRLARQRPSSPFWHHVVTADDIAAESMGNTFLMFFQHEDRFRSVTVMDGSTHLHDLAAVDEVNRRISAQVFELRRAATDFGASWASRGSSFLRASTALDDLLLKPTAELRGDRPLVVCPVGALARVAWSTLPSCRGRAVSVIPSASVWHAARRSPATDGPVVAAHGPGLPEASAELDDVLEAHGGGVLLRGGDATVSRVLEACGVASVLHLAAHGRLRRDNPLFSSLTLSDGQLTGHDLETCNRVPPTVVLSACDSGRGSTIVAEETLGLAWTLLSLGSRSVVAPLSPVPDTESREVMREFHARLGLS